MSREKKSQTIEQLKEDFAKYEAGILTSYRGIPTSEMNVLRRRLREAKAEYKVVKNTLARLAAQRAGRGNLASAFDGQIAIAFSSEDVTEFAKVLLDYIRTSKSSLGLERGFVGNRLLSAEEVMTLSTLPSREILLSQVVGGLQTPLYALLGCLTSPLRGMVGILKARMQQLEGG